MPMGEAPSDIAAYLEPSAELTVHERMAIYQHQYWYHLSSVLKDQFPSLVKWLGETTFQNTIAFPYLKKYAPIHWNLHKLGDRLPAELKHVSFQQALAELDLAFWHVNLVPGEAVAHDFEHPIYLQPFVKPLRFSYPLLEFRHDLLAEKGPSEPSRKKIYYFLLFRNTALNLTWKTISQPEWVLLDRLQKPCTLDDAAAVLQAFPEEKVIPHLMLWFREWMGRGWICG